MGGKKTELLKYETEDGKTIELPSALIIGENEGPEAVITAGVHSGEYCAIFAALSLFRDLTPADINGSLKILPVCDVVSFEHRCRSVKTLDGMNLNRCFPGKVRGSYTESLAARVFDEIKGADFHIDMHSAATFERAATFALYHRGRRGDLNDRSHEIAYYFGIPYIVITETEGRFPDKGTLYSEVYEKIGIPSVFVETGSLGISDPEHIKKLIDGTLNVLRRFGTLKGAVKPVGKPQIFENMEYIHARGRGINYRRVSVGDSVRRGQLIGVLTDYFGRPTEKIVSPVNGRIIFLSESPAITPDTVLAGIAIGK